MSQRRTLQVEKRVSGAFLKLNFEKLLFAKNASECGEYHKRTCYTFSSKEKYTHFHLLLRHEYCANRFSRPLYHPPLKSGNINFDLDLETLRKPFMPRISFFIRITQNATTKFWLDNGPNDRLYIFFSKINRLFYCYILNFSTKIILITYLEIY